MKHQSFQSWCIANNHEELLLEWDFEKNREKGIFPDKIGCKSSTRKVWWRCNLGHSYDAYISNRVRREDGCPYCSNHRLLIGFNDLAFVVPGICKEWDYEKNRDKHNQDISMGVRNPHPANPSDILYGSAQKVFWKCEKGHTSYMSPNARHTNKDGSFALCDICANKNRAESRRIIRAEHNNLLDKVPEVGDEWVYSEHGKTPSEVSCISTELVHWRCKRGHEFDKRVADRIGFRVGKYFLRQCGECLKHRRTSIVEQICYYYTKQVFSEAINSYKENRYEFDVFIPSKRIGIEYDGSYTHRTRLERDNKKDIYADTHNIQLFRFRAPKLPNTVFAHRITVEETFDGVIEGLRSFFAEIGVTPPVMNLEKDYNKIMLIFNDRINQSISSSSFISEWDFEKNTIDPRYITCTESHIKVWWKCNQGHPSFLSYPYNRTARKTMCPICSHKKSIEHIMRRVQILKQGNFR